MTESDSSANPNTPFVQRGRSSRWMRRLFVFGVVSTVAVVFCCVATIAIQSIYGPTFTTEAAEVEATLHKVVPMEIPSGFQATEAYSADNSLVWLQAARFDQEAGRGQLVVVEVRVRPVPNDKKYDETWLKVLTDKLAPDLRLMDVKQTREKSLTIRGESVTFQIVEGTDRASTRRLRQVTGTFPGRESRAILILQAEEEFLSHDAVNAMLQSLADKPASK